MPTSKDTKMSKDTTKQWCKGKIGKEHILDVKTEEKLCILHCIVCDKNIDSCNKKFSTENSQLPEWFENKDLVEILVRKLLPKLFWWAKEYEIYGKCYSCGSKLDESLFFLARRKLEKQTCSNCFFVEKNKKELCCELATRINCVCRISFKCPKHFPEGKHVGTHD